MNIFTILGKNYDSNVYVINGKIPSIIDTGTGLYSNELINKISEFINLLQIKQIILTHEHYDHVGGTLDILNASGQVAKIYAHQNIVKKLNKGESHFARLLGGEMPKVKVDVELSDNDIISIGDEKFDVLYTPGHSLGSICLYCANNGSLISGDTVFANGDFGRYDLPGGNFPSLKESIEHLSSLDVKNLYPGHGPIIEKYGKDHVLKSFKNIKLMI